MVKEEGEIVSIHEKEFGENSIPSLFKKYALPGVVSMLFIALQFIVDGLVVGNMLGPNALAGVNIVLPLYSLLTAMMIVISIGSQTLVSIGQGQGDYKKAANAMTTGIVAVTAVCIILGVALYIWQDPIVSALGGNDELQPHSCGYLRGTFIFFVGIGFAMYNDYMLRSLGKPNLAMILMSSAVVLNIILSVVFTMFTDMGTFGVGLATTIAFSATGVISTIVLIRPKEKVKLFSGRFKTKILGRIIYNGSSEGVNEFAAGLTILLFNITMMEFVGKDGVAAFTVVNYIYVTGIFLLVGSSDSIIPIMSYNYGAKKFDRCRKLYRFTATINLMIGTAIAVLLGFFNENIIDVFFEDASPEIITMAGAGAAVYAFAFLCNGFNILTSGFFTAIADAKRSVVISSLRSFVLIAIALYVIPRTIGVEYIWYSVPFAEVCTLVISIILFRKQTAKWGR